ncbi:hypothetical protein GCWU000341_00024 [Oribacterium sp. oral taxon 078 str. F0262]|nr:hypothetical protein GCWU000341_00024 [Oribacterium sp. oral taxon 078 str. F0262]
MLCLCPFRLSNARRSHFSWRERRSLPSGRLGAFLSLLEEKCLPEGGRLNRVYIVCFT